jgi:secreted trypsin-like serine protease
MGRVRLALSVCLALALLTSVQVAQAQSPQPRVVGGSTTTIDQYPWQAALVYSQAQYPSQNAHQRQFCGGSLVTASIMITAAHCLYDTDPDCNGNGGVSVCQPSDPGGDGTKRIDPNDIDVVLGRTTLSNTSSGVEHASRDVSYDASYDPNASTHDVGYLVLQSPSGQATIDIAGPDEDAVWAPGVVEDVSGWGSTSEIGDTVDTLRAASVPIVSDSTCGSAAIYGSEFSPATMVCAGYLAGGVDTCYGDSGGPLEAPLEGGGYRLVGITSWGFGCAEPNAPGVYTRIAGSILRDAAVAKVAALEGTYSLPTETIVGSGGQPLTSPPPAGGGGSSTETPTTETSPAAEGSSATGKRAAALRKCKTKQGKARKRCIKRAKRLPV